MCNIFVHTALAWFALGQKLIGGAIGAAGRLDAPNDYLCREKFHKLVTPNQIGKLEVCLCLVEHIGLVGTWPKRIHFIVKKGSDERIIYLLGWSSFSLGLNSANQF